MRIITGALAFFEQQRRDRHRDGAAALAAESAAQYSLTSTMSSASMPTQRATGSTVRATLCVEQCRYSLPFCQ